MGKQTNWEGFELFQKINRENPKLSPEECGELVYKLQKESICGMPVQCTDLMLICALLDPKVVNITFSVNNKKYIKKTMYLNEITHISLTNELNPNDKLEYAVLHQETCDKIYLIDKDNRILANRYVKLFRF